MSETKHAKFKVGQVVMLKSVKKPMPFQILDVRFDDGEWFYAWSRKNCAHENMIRVLTMEEIGVEVITEVLRGTVTS